ncbi:MAG: hypothetical protein AAGA45_05335, partial [Verrucomicrobiota bacterium]
MRTTRVSLGAAVDNPEAPVFYEEMQAHDKLKAWFEGCPGALVAFSGGVDSSLVAYLARLHLGAQKCIAVISASPSLKAS